MSVFSHPFANNATVHAMWIVPGKPIEFLTFFADKRVEWADGIQSSGKHGVFGHNGEDGVFCVLFHDNGEKRRLVSHVFEEVPGRPGLYRSIQGRSIACAMPPATFQNVSDYLELPIL